MNAVTFSVQDVVRIAALAKIPVTKDEVVVLAAGFTATMAVVEKLKEAKVANASATYYVTGLENVYREDIVEDDRMLTQDQALSNAKRTYNGFFVVDKVLPGE